MRSLAKWCDGGDGTGSAWHTAGVAKPTLARLRRHAVANSLFRPGGLATALRRLGFVQADPIRAPARAQDLILRHRVKGYRAGQLERRYPKLQVEEDVLYAYGFVSRDVWQWIHTPNSAGLSKLEARVLAAVRELGETHPRQLDEEFGRKRVVNAWGGFSKQTRQVLEALHRRGLVRVARRDKGVRVYGVAPARDELAEPLARFRELVLVAVNIFAPALETALTETLSPVRRRRSIDARSARRVVDDLVASGALVRATVDGKAYVWPAGAATPPAAPRVVRFLAPFDPLIWDRKRFEQLWAWQYRFEAYTPKAKRVRGYYAMPLLWADQVIGWSNVSATDDGGIDVDVGFVDGRPKSKAFSRELDAEIERVRIFL